MDKNKVIESATKFIAKGQLDKAVREYQRILEVDPDDVRVLQKLAELYQKMQRREDAADCFEKVAKTYSAQGFYLKAVALYKQVLKVVDRIEVNVRLAELYQQLGLVGDATKEWQNVAAYYEKVGDSKASLDTLKKLVDLDPDNVAARIRLGEQYARQDNLVEAVAELRRASAYLQRNGRTDDYLRVAERISHLDQGDVQLAKELAESYLAKGDSKRALAKLQICFKANPRDLGTLTMLARAFQELGQTSKTVSVLKELARVHLDTGKDDEAKRVYQQALEIAPDDAELKSSIKQLETPAEPAHVARPPSTPIHARPATGPIQTARPATGPIQTQRPATGPIQTQRPGTGPISGPINTDPLAARTGAVRQPTGPIAPPPPVPVQPAPISAPPPPTQSGPVSVAKLLKETEVYVKYGLNEKALDHLRKIFAVEPENVDAHEKAKQLAVAMNRPEDAAASLATLVRLYAARSDSRAEGAKAELAGIDPAHPALQIGPSIGPPASLGDDFDDVTSVDMAPPVAAPAQPAEEDDGAEVVEEFAVGDDDEERTAVDAAPPAHAEEPAHAEALARPAEEEADPFAVTDEEALEQAVLTGEVFEDSNEAVVDEPEPELAARVAASTDLEPEMAAPHGAHAAEDDVSIDEEEQLVAPPSVEEEDEFASDLAEADFYIDAGLAEDARGILEGILLGEPSHPGARARLAQLGGEQPPPLAAPASNQASFGDDDGEETKLDARPPAPNDDLASELAAELADEVAGLGTLADPDEPLDTGPLDPFEVPVHQVLGEFRAKVQETVRPEDAQTHYDLGIAYKEMGLLEEAVAEFEVALKHGHGVRKVDCISMLGVCAMEKGRPEEAVKVFLRGLSESDVPEGAKRALMFELAIAYEAIGETGLAIEQYKNVERVEPGFRDVVARVHRLGGTISGPIKKAPPASIVQPKSQPAPAAAAASAPPVPVAGPRAPPAPAPANEPAKVSPPETAQPASSSESPEAPIAQRRNRKIGFV